MPQRNQIRNRVELSASPGHEVQNPMAVSPVSPAASLTSSELAKPSRGNVDPLNLPQKSTIANQKSAASGIHVSAATYLVGTPLG